MEKKRINYGIAKADAETASAANPTFLIHSNQRLSANIAASSIYDIALFKLMSRQPLNVLVRYPRDSVRDNPTFDDVLGHDNRCPVV
jgi:hypothetical protein